VSGAMPLSVDQYEELIVVSQLTCTAGRAETQISAVGKIIDGV